MIDKQKCVGWMAAVLVWVSSFAALIFPAEQEPEVNKEALIVEEARRIAGRVACKTVCIDSIGVSCPELCAPTYFYVRVSFDTLEDAKEFGSSLKRLARLVTEEE